MASRKELRGTDGAPGSAGPSAIASWNSALSATERVSTPSTDRPSQASTLGASGTRPRWVFSPNSPQ